MKLNSPAAARNREPILRALEPWLRPGVHVLEIGSGSGQHAAYFTSQLERVRWQPTDVSPAAIESISAHREESQNDDLLLPLVLDARWNEWPEGRWDVVFSANVIHIAPWSVAEGIVAGAARVLVDGGLLAFYGPFRFSGAFTAPSNERFDHILRTQDPEWGIRDLDALSELARRAGFAPAEITEMPANNHLVVFSRRRYGAAEF